MNIDGIIWNDFMGYALWNYIIWEYTQSYPIEDDHILSCIIFYHRKNKIDYKLLKNITYRAIFF